MSSFLGSPSFNMHTYNNSRGLRRAARAASSASTVATATTYWCARSQTEAGSDAKFKIWSPSGKGSPSRPMVVHTSLKHGCGRPPTTSDRACRSPEDLFYDLGARRTVKGALSVRTDLRLPAGLHAVEAPSHSARGPLFLRECGASKVPAATSAADLSVIIRRRGGNRGGVLGAKKEYVPGLRENSSHLVRRGQPPLPHLPQSEA